MFAWRCDAPSRLRVSATCTSAIIGDLAQPIDWSPHLDGVDALVHAAGLAHAPTKAAERQLFAVNVEATDRLMRAAKQAGVSHAIHISSVRAIAGASCEDIIEEDHRPEPTNDYGRSKLESEKAVAASGLHGAILRPPLVHGAHVRGVALLARLAATPLPLPLPLGGLNARRSIVSDRNLASAVAFVLERPQVQMITALVADAAPLPLPRSSQDCAPAPADRRGSSPCRGCYRGCLRSSDKARSGNRWADSSSLPRAGSRRLAGSPPRTVTPASSGRWPVSAQGAPSLSSLRRSQTRSSPSCGSRYARPRRSC